MAIRVVLEHPPVAGRRAGQSRLRAAGYVMLAITSVLMLPLFVLTIGGIVAIVASLGNHSILPDEWVAPAWWAWGGTMVLTIATRTLADRWLRSNRRLALFLRRFGHTPATTAITLATGQVGGSWRFVTLDDEKIMPVGVSSASKGFVKAYSGTMSFGRAVERLGGKFGGFIGGLGFLGAIGSLIYTLAEEPNDYDRLFDWSRDAHSTAVVVFRISVVLGGIYLAGLVAMLAFGIIAGIATAMLSPLAEAHRSIEWAEKHKQLRAKTEQGIDAIRARITTISRRVFSPRLYVVGVDSSIWQYAIRGFAADVDVPLIDISDPTENVAWEIQTIMYWFGQRVVVVGEYDKVRTMVDFSATSTTNQKVTRLLDGVEILGYRTDAEGQRRFVEALRNKLDDHAQRPLPNRPEAAKKTFART